jgi:Tfp pilus assembly protein PilW
MANRLGAAALSVLMFVLAGAFAHPAFAASGTSDVVAAVNNVSGESDKFRSMMSNINASQIHVVNVQSVMSATDENAYRKALKKNASGISDLRDTLNHTTVTGSDGVLITLRRLLQHQNVTIEQINGVYVGTDGTITLFY